MHSGSQREQRENPGCDRDERVVGRYDRGSERRRVERGSNDHPDHDHARAGASAGASPAPKPAPKVKLGPKDAAVSWAYLKDMYKKDGYWYVVVDYVQVVGPEETIHFVNENPRLRTFPLSSGAKLQLLKSPGSPIYKSVSVAQFKAFENKSGDEVVEVTPKGGYAMKLKQWWAP